MKGNRQKTVKVKKPKTKEQFKRDAIVQLCAGIALVVIGFLSLFGAFTLFGGGFLVLAASSYLQYKGEKKKVENPEAEPSDSLNFK
ncbi:MAG: hypothetical protein IKZ30_00035 [Oscillospiraceae bacterium]|nr:hypothetical protein [Oscillospiraceae bacterium]